MWDDEYFVVNDPAIRTVTAIPRYFTDASTYAFGTWAPMYRPMRNLSYLLNLRIAGLSPAWFHLHNVLLHAANSVLVYLLLSGTWTLTARRRPTSARALRAVRNGCLLGTLFWCLHPVQTEAVAWVKGRDEMLFSFFYLAATLLLLRGVLSGEARLATLAGAWLLFVLSLLSKEMAVSWPVVAAGVLWMGRPAVRGARAVLFLGACVAATAGFVLARHLVIGQTEQTGYLAGSFVPQMLTSVCAAGRYLRVVVAPSGLLADYDSFRMARSPLSGRFIVAFIGMMGTVIVALLARRRAPLAAVGIAWFWILLLPVSNIVPTMQHLAERFLYLPLVGAGMVVAAAWIGFERAAAAGAARAHAQDARLRRRAGIGLAAAWLLALTAGSLARLPDWSSNLRLHESSWRTSGGAPRATLNYGVTLTNNRRHEDAVRILAPLTTSPAGLSLTQTAAGLAALGMSQIALGNFDAGFAAAENAAQLDPLNAGAYAAMGLCQGRKGDHAAALKSFSRAVELRPLDENLRRNLETAKAKVAVTAQPD